MRRLGSLGVIALVLFAGSVSARTGYAQTGTTLVQLPVPLLGPSMGSVARAGDAVTGENADDADAAHAAVLREDGFQRFAKAKYGRSQVEALQFRDASGARAAYSLYTKDGSRPGLKPDEHGLSDSAVVDGRQLVLRQTVVLIAETGADTGTVTAITSALPLISGPRSQRPLLPTLLPSKGKVERSEKYALGPLGYVASGGSLGAASLGWEKNAEAVTARYADGRGKETLTLLLYPTPQIAGEHTRALEQSEGRERHTRSPRRELVAVAQGSFSADDAQNMVENVHLLSEVSFDKPMPLEFQGEIHKTYSLLKSVVILSGVGGLGAVMLGLFLGFGRASIRKLRGKEVSSDIEFLSLHLEPQNERVKFDPPVP